MRYIGLKRKSKNKQFFFAKMRWRLAFISFSFVDFPKVIFGVPILTALMVIKKIKPPASSNVMMQKRLWK